MKNIKNTMKWGKLALALALGAALLLSGCGDTSSSSSSPRASATPSPAVSPTASATSAPKQAGGEIFIAMPQNAEDLDPLAATDEDMINLLSLVYDSAVKLGADGQPQPGLAESWEVDGTGAVYTFHFRQNLTFQDGVTPFNVDDVIYSLERVLALSGAQVTVTDQNTPAPGESGTPDGENAGNGEDTPSSSASPDATPSSDASPSPSDGQETDTVELPWTNHYAQYNDLVAGMERVDDNTLRVTMTKPGVEALYFMHCPIVSKTLFDAKAAPVGTGAYKVESYEPNAQMILGINDGWWGDRPYITRIVAKAVTGSVQKIEAVESSVLDFITTDVLYAGKYISAGKTQVVDYMTNYYDCLLPNLQSAKLGDVNVRQAITYAIDRRTIISTVLLNHAVPANMPIAPDFYAYDSKYKQDDDLETAREYLRAAGYRSDQEEEGNVLELVLIVPTDRDMTYRVEAAKAIKKQLKKIGVEVTVEEQTQADYYQNLQSGSYELAYCSYYLDENPDLSFLLTPGGTGNYNSVNSQEITDAIAAANNAFSEAGIKAAYSELQRLLMERVPQIGLYYRMNSIICDESIKGISEPRQDLIYSHINEWYIVQNYS